LQPIWVRPAACNVGANLESQNGKFAMYVLRMRVSVCCKAARPTNQSTRCICAEAWPTIALWLQSKCQSHLENREVSEACPRSKVSPRSAASVSQVAMFRIGPSWNSLASAWRLMLSSFTDEIRHRYASLMLKSWPQRRPSLPCIQAIEAGRAGLVRSLFLT
jgi:hypothetical protein